jgi:ABC-2 type transport system permease protein
MSRWWKKTALVAERELRQRGRSRAFTVSTIVLLLVVAAGVVIPAIVAHRSKPQRVGVVGGQAATMTQIVQEAGRLTDTSVTVVPQPSVAAAEAALLSGDLDVVLVWRAARCWSSRSRSAARPAPRGGCPARWRTSPA